MRKLFLVLLTASFFVNCSNTKSERADNDNPKDEKNDGTQEENNNIDEKNTDESSVGSWSEEDKKKFRKEWAKTFAQWKDGLQGEEGFDEADFDNEAKKVENCTLKVFENKFPSYSKYKKANDRDHFQSDPDLLNEIADCQERMMNKYNRQEEGSY